MTRTLALAFAVFASWLAATSVSAHHSFSAAFDMSKPVTVQGTIAQVRLENPHSWFFLDVTDASGKVSKWSFEASTPTSLIRSGVKPGFIKAGDQVTIKGYHARDATANVGAAREIFTAYGRAYAVGPAFSPAR